MNHTCVATEGYVQIFRNRMAYIYAELIMKGIPLSIHVCESLIKFILIDFSHAVSGLLLGCMDFVLVCRDLAVLGNCPEGFCSCLLHDLTPSFECRTHHPVLSVPSRAAGQTVFPDQHPALFSNVDCVLAVLVALALHPLCDVDVYVAAPHHHPAVGDDGDVSVVPCPLS